MGSVRKLRGTVASKRSVTDINVAGRGRIPCRGVGSRSATTNGVSSEMGVGRPISECASVAFIEPTSRADGWR